MTTDTTPTKRGPGRPPGPVVDTDRYLSHTDAERELARAKLRSAADRWRVAKAAFDKAERARHVAILQARETGINDPEIGRVLAPLDKEGKPDPSRAVHAGHVGRLRARAKEQGIGPS